MSMLSPVCGLRPVRALRARASNVPKPGSVDLVAIGDGTGDRRQNGLGGLVGLGVGPPGASPHQGRTRVTSSAPRRCCAATSGDDTGFCVRIKPVRSLRKNTTQALLPHRTYFPDGQRGSSGLVGGSGAWRSPFLVTGSDLGTGYSMRATAKIVVPRRETEKFDSHQCARRPSAPDTPRPGSSGIVHRWPTGATPTGLSRDRPLTRLIDPGSSLQVTAPRTQDDLGDQGEADLDRNGQQASDPLSVMLLLHTGRRIGRRPRREAT